MLMPFLEKIENAYLYLKEAVEFENNVWWKFWKYFID